MSTIRKFSLALILLFNLINLSFAQNAPPAPTENPSVTTSSNIDSSTPSGATKGVNPSIGSYGGSNFDKVNLFSGNVSMSFPLASLTSRGGMSAGVVLSYNSKLWRVERQEDDMTSTSTNEVPNPVMTYHPVYDEPDKGLPLLAAGWTIHAGRMSGRQTAIGISKTCFFPTSGSKISPKPLKTVTIFVFTAPDGTEYDFRDAIYDGEPKSLNSSCEGINREKKFVSKDGTFATFINDIDVVDGFFTDQILEPSGYVYLRDGTRFRIDKGRPTEQRDHNGNILRYEYDPGGRLILVTDNMGRTITVSYGDGQALATITIKGFGGTDRVTTVKGKRIKNLLPVNQQLNVDQLFPVPAVQISNQGMEFNPKVVSEVILPDNHKWEFQYNSYGEVVQVKTPARGLVQYEMGPSTQAGGGYIQTDDQIFRRVMNRRTYPLDTGPVEGKVVYTDPSDPNFRENDINGNANVNVTEEEVDPNNSDNVITRTKHKFFSYPTKGLAGSSARVQNPNTYRPWLDGKELETYQLNPSLTGTASIMRTTTTTYEQQAAVAWVQVIGQNDPNQPENNSRVKKVISELNDDEPGDTEKISKVDYDYDQYNNVINEKLTGFNNEVIREVTRGFITNLHGINYAELNRDVAPASNPNEFDTHLRSLVAEETIKNGFGQIESKTVFEYDVYSGQFHAGLVPRTLTFSSQGQVYRSVDRIQRGNVTAVTAGVITPDTPATPGTPSTTFPQYDVLGNVVAVVGPLPNQRSETEYSADSQFAFPVQTKQFVFGGLSGDRILTSSREFDFRSGLVKKAIGLNGEVTTFEYNDLLDRLTREVRPQSSGISLYTDGFGTTTYSYSLPGVFPNTVSVQTTLDTGRLLESTSEFDGFLRSTKQKRTDPNGEVISQTTYDATGRVKQVTNPFRTGEQATTEGYITSEYDPLDRVKLITTFDRSASSTGVVTTNYSTNQVTVTDQAGKKRKSITDAAGRLTSVFEPDQQNNLTLVTIYGYDARSNLLQVNQGEQTRTFTYDAMSRLLTATSPESGTTLNNGVTTYQYNPASNLTLKLDPRGITTTYTYDSLNRLSTKGYSDTTPSVSYFYDVVPTALPSGVTLPNNGFTFQHTLGRITAVASPTTARELATGLFHNYDIGGRIARSSQLLDGQHYITNSSYNEASLPTRHTYPSGRTIAHSYNIAGQITQVNSNNEIISEQATYTAAGAIKSHKLGNGLYHQMQYNSRLQPTSITLGNGLTGQAAENKWKQEYNYGVYESQSLSNATTPPNISTNQNQNNGNIGHIKLTPGIGQNPISQFFAYDELNRLKVAKEYYAKVTVFAPSQGGVGIANQDYQYQFFMTLDGTNLENTTSIEVSPNQGVSVVDFFASPTTVNITFSIDAITGAGSKTVKALNSQGQILAQAKLDITLPPAVVQIEGCCGEAAGCTGGTFRILDPNDPVNGILTIRESNVFNFPPTVIGDQTITATASERLFNDALVVTNSFGQTTYACLLNFSRAKPCGKDSLDLDNDKDKKQKDNKPDSVKPYYFQIFDPDTLSWSQEYSYDRYGNRFQVQGTNPQDLPISTSKNRITAEGFVYDNAGNSIKDPTSRDYFYDAENRLIKVSLDVDGTTIVIAKYFYDAQGWRVKKDFFGNITRFVYDQGGRLLAEYEGEPVPGLNTPAKENIYAPSGMLATVEPDKINYHTPDHLGSPRILTDGTGAIISRRDFLPFGEQLSDSLGNRFNAQGYSSADNIKHKFTGYERDQETGLDFAQARHFNSALGRFMQVDEFTGGPIELFSFADDASNNPTFYADIEDPQSLNKYQYGFNNPLRFNDPTGHLSQDPTKRFADYLNALYQHFLGKTDPDSPDAKKGGTPGPLPSNKASAVNKHAEVTAEGIEEISDKALFLDKTGVGTIFKESMKKDSDNIGLLFAVGGSIVGGGGKGASTVPADFFKVAREWAKDPVKNTITASIKYHFKEHAKQVDAKDIYQYLRKASAFKDDILRRGASGSKDLGGGKTRYWKNSRYIILDKDKKIISFGKAR